MLTTICGFILMCYIGFWVLVILILFLMETWWILLIAIIIFIIIGIAHGFNEMGKETEMRNNSIRTSIWNYCRYNGLKDVTCDSERKLLDVLAKDNKLGLSEYEFKNHVYNIVNNYELCDRLDRGFVNHSRCKATNIYHKCKDLRIKDGNIDGNEKKWNVIAATFDIPVDVAKELFVRQCDEYKIQKDKKRAQERLKKDKEKKNAQLLLMNKMNEIRNSEDKLYIDELNISKNIGKARYTYSNINIYSKLIDLDDVEEKVNLLNFDIGDYKITEFKNFFVPIGISYKKDIKLFGKDAVLDGSFRIRVLDKSNNLVAVGIVNGLIQNNKIYGFKKLSKNVLCKCLDEKLVDGRKSYNIEISLISLWLLEL
jgi:hypothetical protein